MARQAVGSAKVQWDDVQGFVLRGYGKQPYGCYSLLKITDPVQAKAFLLCLTDHVTTCTTPPSERAIQVAISASALQKFGVSNDLLATFSVPFVEGMVTDHRSRVLGDQGSDAPENWAWGYTPETTPDMMVIVFTKTHEDVAKACEEVLAEPTGCSIIQQLEAYISPDQHEHFGFLDGISQPLIDGALTSKGEMPGDTASGELILGYPNSLGLITPVPEIGVEAEPEGAFGQNGSYMVLRQMNEDVKGFNDFISSQGMDSNLLAAKLLGRWRDGSPLELYPTAPKPGSEDEKFGYADDPYGRKCPIGAHIRRANPRDGLTNPEAPPSEAQKTSLEVVSHHRVLRRGRLYGPLWRPAKNELYVDAIRGLNFIVINASIENQFEFVQQTWLNSTKFSNLYDEVDPLVGVNQTCPDSSPYSIPISPARRQLPCVPRFISVRGGAYFFMPGIKGLRMLSRLPNP